MKINIEWLEKQKIDPDTGEKADPYVSAIIKIGEKVVDLIEQLPEDAVIDANALITQASKEVEEEGITGNMAGYIAMIAVKCHSRGEEFKKSWNRYWGKEDAKGVVNPAIVTIG